MRSFHLAAQLLHRDGRSGELTVLFAALLIAVSAVLTISLLTDRLGRALAQESAELIGGDLVIESTREPDTAWLETGRDLGLATAQIYRFQSVLFHGEAMQLCSIKAVTPGYPLLGQLEARESPGSEAAPVAGIPAPGHAWVDARVLDGLDADIGDRVDFGATTLTLEKILTFEPDQGAALFQFAPRVLINAADLEAAEVLGPGSRIRYRTLFHGDAATIDQLRQRLEPPLETGHQLIEPATGDDSASQALQRATEYIRIATLLSIALAAIAIALTARRYSQRHFDVSAMLRCLGARHRDIVRLYLYQLVILTTTATLLAAALGWAAHWAVLQVLAPLMPVELPPAGTTPWLVAGGSAFLLMAGFALPPVLRLARTPPLRVLRRDLSPLPLSVWLVYGLAAVSQLLLLWLLFDELTRVFLILVGAALGLLATAALIYLGLRALRGRFRGAGLASRSLRNLAAHAATSTSQIMAFGITLLILIVMVQLRTGLLEEWRLQLPENAPNHFAFNLFPHQVEAFRDKVAPVADLEPLYPVIRGRMLSVNGDRDAVTGGGDNDRELNLTWTDELPEDNEIVAGSWPPQSNGVSIEKNYADRLGVTLGDSLRFNVGGQEFEATVTSIRTVVWESFSPNFFLIFSEQQLGDMPTTYLTSFHLPPEEKGLRRELAQAFPAMTLVEVDAIVERLETVLSQVSLSVEMVMLFVLLGGFAVLFATLQSTADERLREGALMRAVGASRGYLKRAYLAEFALLGFAAGVLAVSGAELATALIYEQVFGLDFRPSPLMWLAVPPATALMVALAGYLGSRKVMQVSPVMLLNP